MKKEYLGLIIIVLGVLFLSGCSSSPEKLCLKECESLSSMEQIECQDSCRMGEREYGNPVDNSEADYDALDKAVPSSGSKDSSNDDVCDEDWTYFECEEYSGQYKDSCYAELAPDKEEECICTNKVEDASLKNACYAAVADTKVDYTICDNIDAVSYGTIQDGCYSAIAEKTESIDPCNKMNNEMLKDGCYQMVASQLGDASICDMISSSAIKMACEMELS